MVFVLTAFDHQRSASEMEVASRYKLLTLLALLSLLTWLTLLLCHTTENWLDAPKTFMTTRASAVLKIEMPDSESVNVISIMTLACVSSSWVLNCVIMQRSRNIFSRLVKIECVSWLLLWGCDVIWVMVRLLDCNESTKKTWKKFSYDYFPYWSGGFLYKCYDTLKISQNWDKTFTLGMLHFSYMGADTIFTCFIWGDGWHNLYVLLWNVSSAQVCNSIRPRVTKICRASAHCSLWVYLQVLASA